MLKIDKLYFGIVESVNDPLQTGRVQVRIFGIHSESKTALPTAKLPWCDVFQSVPQPFISGIGLSPTGMVNGSMVALLPKDPEFLQEWFVCFTMGGFRSQYGSGDSGFNDPEGFYPKKGLGHDVNILARGTSAIPDELGDISGTIDASQGATADKLANLTKSSVDADQKEEEKPKEVDPKRFDDAPWMKFVVGEVGKNEKDNPDRIKEYHTQGGGSSSWGGETPWCASFCGWSLKQASKKGTGTAMARGYANYGEDVSTKTPIPYGAIVVVKGNRGPSSGHVCFYTGESGDRINVIGGNQGAKNNQNGGEVTNSSFKKSDVIGYRWPK
mgnify:CR=1 FL=1